MSEKFLMDTHALVFWVNEMNVSEQFIEFFNKAAIKGNVFFSAISFWEIALLTKKKRIEIKNITKWKNEILQYSPGIPIEPTPDDMIKSAFLPEHHKDPFDRLLIAQAVNNKLTVITKDSLFAKYKVKTIWVD